MEENKSILEQVVDIVISSVQLGGKETHTNLLSAPNEYTAKELLAVTQMNVFKLLPIHYADLVDHIDLEPKIGGDNYNALLITVYRK